MFVWEWCLCVNINRQGPAVALLLNGLASHMPTFFGPVSLPLCVCVCVCVCVRLCVCENLQPEPDLPQLHCPMGGLSKWARQKG